MMESRVGTPLYLSPELVRRQPYDFKVDVWSLGCLVYTLAALRPPFEVRFSFPYCFVLSFGITSSLDSVSVFTALTRLLPFLTFCFPFLPTER